MDLGPMYARGADQCGAITHRQLVELGWSPRQIEHLAATGLIIRVHRGVYRLGGAPPTWEQSIWAASLAAGPSASISHRSALGWWPMERCDTTVLHLATDDVSRVRLDGVRAHQTFDLPAADRRRHRGLQVTSVERSLIDAGRYLSPRKIGAVLDHAVRDGLTTYERFQRRVQELARQGRNGIGTSRLVLAAKGYGDGFGFEKAMRGLLRDAGLPAPQREFKVHVDGHRFRIDFAYPDSMLGIECDSSEWHELKYQRDHDLARQNRIQNQDLLLLRYTVERLRNDRDGVRDEIIDAVTRRAGTGTGPTSVFPDAKPPHAGFGDSRTG